VASTGSRAGGFDGVVAVGCKPDVGDVPASALGGYEIGDNGVFLVPL
jgi:hypothetical protein